MGWARMVTATPQMAAALRVSLPLTHTMTPISIGIPFYNAQEFLADAIRSVFAQTYQDWELILVDDGSTDRSLEIARAVRDPRVRVLSDGENRKLPYRLNQITAEARYDFIGRMDADDLISPARFEKEMAVLAAHPEVDLVSTGVCSITKDGRPIGIRNPSPGGVTIHDVLPMKGCVITHAAILGRKAWFLRNSYDTYLQTAQDAELWVRACAKKDLRVDRIPEPLYYYREDGNVTLPKSLRAYRVHRELFRTYGHLRYGPLGKRIAITKSYGKSVVVWCLTTMNRLEWLLHRRSQAVESPNLRARLCAEIDQIRRTRVPGLD
ncbi:MAG: glycosyltransferase [Phycisphaerae bacterium]|nr:glycosyltransferase [Phycisphaerae bacterium]